MDGTRVEQPYRSARRERAKTVVKVGMALMVALMVSGFLAAGWGGIRRARQRTALAREWGMDEATSERVSGILEREVVSPDERAVERYFDRLIEERQRQGAPVDRRALRKSVLNVMTARGWARLSDPDLAELHALRKRVAFASERSCPCQLDPSKCTTADSVDGLKDLSDAELARWGLLAGRAAILEARSSGPLPSAVDDFNSGLGALLDRQEAATQARVAKVFEQKGGDKGEVCFATRAIYTGAELLDEAAYRRFIRAFLAVSAQ
jgi:hypothetical protein